MDWTEKYRPKSLSEVRGNNKSVENLKKWAENWEKNKKPALIHGRPGIGKTSSLYALANDKEWDIVELNASDKRTSKSIKEITEASKSTALTGKKRLIILDEADNLHGNADRGGAKAVSDLLKKSEQPIALIANQPHEIPRGIRNKCEEIKFRNVGKRSIIPVLRDIIENENIEIKKETLEEIAERNSGDLRSAIKDLQAILSGSSIEDHTITTSQRDREEDIFNFLNTILKNDFDLENVLRKSRELDKSPKELFKWIDENISKVYSQEELEEAYSLLSRASIYLNRTQETQDYSFWRYAGAMLIGVGTAKKESKGGWTRYSPPRWESKSKTKAERKIAKKEITSIDSTRELLPYIELILEEGQTINHISWLGLSTEEIKELTGWNEEKIEEKTTKNKSEKTKKEKKTQEKGKEEDKGGQSSLSQF